MINNNWTEQDERKLQLVKGVYSNTLKYYSENPSRIKQSISQKYIQLLEQRLAA